MKAYGYRGLVVLGVVLIGMLMASQGWAKSSYLSQARAIYPGITGTALDDCTLCHTSSIPDLNSFGSAYMSNGRNAAALGKIAKPDQDADGDGVPNLVEILKLSFPGNSSSKPAPAAADAVELIPLWGTWKYLDTGVAPAADWKMAAFNDSAWASGPAQLGYGGIGESKTVSYGGNASKKYATTYFRAVVTADPGMAYSNLQLNMLRNDGAVVYLNGTEILRSNMPSGMMANTTMASGSSDAWVAANVNASLLVPGANILAVEIHQASASGADIAFNLSLDATAVHNNAARGWTLFR